MLDDILNLIKKTREDMLRTIPTIDTEIDNIIQNKIHSQHHIEQLLDVLLDYGFLGLGKEQFMKLNSYYATFNKKYSDKYFKFYKELEKKE